MLLFIILTFICIGLWPRSNRSIKKEYAEMDKMYKEIEEHKKSLKYI